jgi:putative membrane protein
MEQMISGKYMLAAVVYSFIGLIILFLSLIAFDKFTPGDLWHEIVEKHNVAMAITVGAVTIAVAQIIASAIHG